MIFLICRSILDFGLCEIIILPLMRKKCKLMKLVIAKWGVYKNRSNLLEHLNTFNMLNTQLSNLGVNLEKEDKAILLLASLPHLLTI
jgi:hypothetical protein